MRQLTDRQRRFVDEYLIDLNARAASARVGYSPGAAGSVGSRMLRRPHVRAAISAAMEVRAGEARITSRAVLDELANVAFFDPGALFDAKGEPVAPDKLDRRVRAGIGSFEIVESEGDARKGASRRIRVRGGEKVRALWLLGRHMGVSIPEAGRHALDKVKQAEAQALAWTEKERHPFGSNLDSKLSRHYAYQLFSGLERLAREENEARARGEALPERAEEMRFLEEVVRGLWAYVDANGEDWIKGDQAWRQRGFWEARVRALDGRE